MYQDTLKNHDILRFEVRYKIKGNCTKKQGIISLVCPSARLLLYQREAPNFMSSTNCWFKQVYYKKCAFYMKQYQNNIVHFVMGNTTR